MMPLSRRAFLQLSGVTLGGAFLAQPITTIFNFSKMVRVLYSAKLYAQPNENSPVIAQLHPDQVWPAQGGNPQNGWLQFSGGYARLENLQAMLAPQKDRQITSIPQQTQVEVTAPYLAIRQYAAAAAPLQTRLHHGDVLSVDYALRNDDGRLWLRSERGWLQAAHVQHLPQMPPHRPSKNVAIALDSQRQELRLYDHGHVILCCAARIPLKVPDNIEIIDICPTTDQGKMWHIQLKDGHEIYGQALWQKHPNQTRFLSTRSVVVSTIAARFLYHYIVTGRAQIR